MDVVVNDGTDPSALNTVTIGVTAANDAPTTDLNGAGGGDDATASFTEQTPVVIAPVATIADLDSATLVSLTATLTARPDGDGVESLSLNATAQTAATGAGLTVLYTAATGVLLINGPAAALATYQTILQGIVYNNTSDAPDLTDRTVNVVVNDGTDPSALNTVTISLTAVNDAPVVTPATLTAVDEDTASPSGESVLQIFNGGTDFFTDPDQPVPSISGIAVSANTANAGTQGTWEYSTDGITWFAIGAVTATNALALNSNTSIRFVPVTNFNGTPPALSVFGLDETFASGGGTFTVNGTRSEINTSPNGGGTAISDDPTTLSTSITAVNDAPTVIGGATKSLAATNEDNTNPPGTLISAEFGPHFSDAEDTVPAGSTANTFAGIAISANAATAAQGIWQWSTNGTTWNNISTALSNANALVLAATTQLRFLPALNFNGTAPALTAHLIDNSAGAVTNNSTVNLTTIGTGDPAQYSTATVALSQAITAVNDTPVNTVPGAPRRSRRIPPRRSQASPSPTSMPRRSTSRLRCRSQRHPRCAHGRGGRRRASHVAGDTTGSVTLTGTTAQINATLGPRGQWAEVSAATWASPAPTRSPSPPTTSAIPASTRAPSGSRRRTVRPPSRTSTRSQSTSRRLRRRTRCRRSRPPCSPPDSVTHRRGPGRPDRSRRYRAGHSRIHNNSATTDATGVNFIENITGVLNGMTEVGGAFNVSPIAFNDAYNAVANATLVVSAANGLLVNDREPGGTNGINIDSTTQVVAGTFATANGSVTLNANGSFSWTANPAVVNFTGPETFSYTVRDAGLNGIFNDADDLIDTATATITITGTAWFIDNSAVGSTNVGTQANPFTSIGAFNTANVGGAGKPDVGDTIYLREGTGTYSEADGINLLNNQVLIGQGENLIVNGITVANEVGAAGDTPTISVTGASQHGIDLGSGNSIRGLNVATTAASQVGIDDGGAGGGTVGALTITNLDVTGVGQAVNIDEGGALSVFIDNLTSTGSGTQGVQLAAVGAALTGTFAVTSGAISGSTGTAFQVGNGDAGAAGTGGIAAISFGGTVSSTGAARAVEIQDRAASAGAVSLSGNVSHTGGNATTIYLDDNVAGNITFGGAANTANSGTANAIHIQDQAGGTVTFSGTVKVNTTSGTGVNMVGNGSIVNFAGGGLDIDTTTGAGFNATGLGGNVISVSGSSNSITTTTGTAINLDGVAVGNGGSTLGITFATVNSSGAANGILIGTVGQQASSSGINIQAGSLSNVTTRGVDIDATSANVSIGASISTSATGRSVEVTNSGVAGGSTIAFSGAIDDNGLGINLDNNDLATITFSGGLDIDTTTSTGFRAVNGGTVNVTGANNSVVSVSATGVNMADTLIGTSGVTFHDISSGNNTAAADPTVGISLVNTGVNAFKVTGGSSTAVGGDGTGGTIQNITGASGTTADDGASNGIGIGIFLKNASNVTIERMQINGTSNFGFVAENTTNLVLKNTTISGTNGDDGGQDEGSVRLLDLHGTNTLDRNNISGGLEDNINVQNNTGTLTDLIISNNNIHDNHATLGNQGILIDVENGVTASYHLTGNTFSHNRADSINIGASGGVSSATALINAVITGNSFNGERATDLGGGVKIQTANFDGHLRYDISSNTFQPTAGNVGIIAGGAINVDADAASSIGVATTLVEGRISSNIIGTAGQANSGTGVAVNAIFIQHHNAGTHTTLISNNNIREHGSAGIALQVGGLNLTTGTFNATITGNTITQPANSAGSTPNGINGTFGTNSTNAETINLDISGNSIAGSGNNVNIGEEDFRLRQRFLTDVNLKGYAGAVNDIAAVVAFIQSQNTGAETEASPCRTRRRTVSTISPAFRSPACLRCSPRPAASCPRACILGLRRHRRLQRRRIGGLAVAAQRWAAARRYHCQRTPHRLVHRRPAHGRMADRRHRRRQRRRHQRHPDAACRRQVSGQADPEQRGRGDRRSEGGCGIRRRPKAAATLVASRPQGSRLLATRLQTSRRCKPLRQGSDASDPGGRRRTRGRWRGRAGRRRGSTPSSANTCST